MSEPLVAEVSCGECLMNSLAFNHNCHDKTNHNRRGLVGRGILPTIIILGETEVWLQQFLVIF
jgi:hypothetical protein